MDRLSGRTVERSDHFPSGRVDGRPSSGHCCPTMGRSAPFAAPLTNAAPARYNLQTLRLFSLCSRTARIAAATFSSLLASSGG
ncbi:Hypothetical protein NTJ_06573 [Nesidiocoris tenuis]|uniref:Uncharacterized protein n=1 Tax=Nesidiocoris tenuis TaxID=355587 RepID=A0ABN7AR44_9HEMI|nr:Hypothetical protein NTJ_06573 [Nesidiocoris tenuis]